MLAISIDIEVEIVLPRTLWVKRNAGKGTPAFIYVNETPRNRGSSIDN